MNPKESIFKLYDNNNIDNVVILAIVFYVIV